VLGLSLVATDKEYLPRVDIIVGLGNPGSRYQHTRHNLGFDVIDVLARRYGIAMRLHAADALCGTGRVGGRMVLLAKPQTYMNVSGRAVVRLVQQYLQDDEQLIVVHDDIDLSLGSIRVKRQGGAAGHRGVQSLIDHLGHGNFVRLRLGIGRPPRQEDIVEYVLSPFSTEETDAYEAMLAQAVERVVDLLTGTAAPSGARQSQ
jgi:peptidyl-tRNA hydrolase, PTH1 family